MVIYIVYLETYRVQIQSTCYFTAQKMNFSIKDFFSKCDQIRSFVRIWSHLLKKSWIENFSFWQCFMFYFFISLSVSLKKVESSFSDSNEGKNVFTVYLKIIYWWALIHRIRCHLEFLARAFQLLFHF